LAAALLLATGWLGTEYWMKSIASTQQLEMIRSLEEESASKDKKIRELEERLIRLQAEIEALGLARPVKLHDPKAISVVEPGRNRLTAAGEFNPVYIQEVRLRWGVEPNEGFTTIHRGGPRPDPDSKPVRFEEVSPELKLNGDAIVATLEFVPYAGMRGRFPQFFTPERMQFSRTFRLAREGIVVDPELVVVTEPHDGQKVLRTENLEGRISIPGAYPVILVKAIVGAEWYVQPAVEETKDG